MKKPARRVRHSPEEARRLILETAQALIARTGPEGLRLQDIAAQAGISHPLILHHFKSRAGLVRALTREAAAEFKDRLVAAMAQPQSSTEELIDRVFGAFAGGLAQRLAWLAMMDPEGEAAEPATVQREIADTLHPAAGRRGLLPGPQSGCRSAPTSGRAIPASWARDPHERRSR
jgi:AcrR family transcriptional regulator